MSNQPEQPNQINIEISEEVSEGVYANLAIITPVLITYRADLEQLLVLLPGHRDDVGH